MPVPDFQTVMLPFLKTLADGQEWLMRDVTEHLANEFKLSPEGRQEMLPSNAQTSISNRVAWAKTYLRSLSKWLCDYCKRWGMEDSQAMPT